MAKCKMCGTKIKDSEVICDVCNEIEDEEFSELIKNREAKDNGKRHSLDDIKKMLEN